MNRLCIRADGNGSIGAGHIMRCLSIAKKLKDFAIEVFFVTADDSFSNKIKDEGFSVEILNTNYAEMEDELYSLKEYLCRNEINAILVDSYFVTKDYLHQLKSLATVIYIDDVYAFDYEVDVLINYNIYADSSVYNTLYESSDHPIPKLLLGLSYVPLRDEFCHIQEIDKDFNNNVLVSVGGSDPERMAKKLVDIFLTNKKFEKLKFNFIIGKYEPDIEYLRHVAENNENIILHENINEMAKLMCSNSIAISAAGSTLYELCACRIPTITYILADNQINGAEKFEQLEIMINIGDVRNEEKLQEKLVEKLELLVNDSKVRNAMMNRQKILLDCLGTFRVGKEIEKLIK